MHSKHVFVLLLVLSLGGCASTPTDIEQAGIDRTIELTNKDVTAVAKCTQFELLSNNPGAVSQVSRGIGDHAEIAESAGKARVWGPSTGLPMFSARFEQGRVNISAQSMFPYSKQDILDAVSAQIALCDKVPS
jgi:hypothetical protein